MNKIIIMKAFFGELIGTFILVFMGCSSVALAISGEVFAGLFQIACVWGLAVFLGIVASAKLSDGHNARRILPAVLQDRQRIINCLTSRAFLNNSDNAAHIFL